MREYIELEGTKEQIVEQLVKYYTDVVQKNGDMIKLTEQDFSRFFDMIGQNCDLLSEEELYEERSKNDSRNCGFVTANAEYYVSIKNSTLLLLSVIADAQLGIPFFSLTLKFFNIESTGGYLAKMDSILGESCILLEAARRRKKGINNKLFKENKGECVNSFLHCKYNIDGGCSCTPDNIKEICKKLEDKKILNRRGNKYFYVI